MDSKNTSIFTCELIQPNWVYVFLTCILLLVSVLALLIHVFFSFLLRRSQAFHSNVRFLLQNFSISACYVSMHSVGRCCYNIVLLFRGFSSVTAVHCEWAETVFNASEGSLTLSMAFIGLDRLISTIRKKHMDSERASAVAYWMVTVCWAAGTAFHILSLYVSSQEQQSRSACYCQEMLVTPMAILYYMVAAFFVTELSTALCYIVLYRYSVWRFSNFTINTAKHSLSERHQMLSNVQTSLFLCPSIILHGTIYAIISLSYLPLRMYMGNVNYLSQVNYALVVLVVMELEMTTQALLFIVRKDTLKKSAVKYLPILGKILTVEDEENGMTGESGGHRNSKVVPVNAIDVANVTKNTRMTGKGALIDFRMKPEENDDILNAMWATTSRHPKSAWKK